MVNVPQVQVPDFAGTVARGQQAQTSRLQGLLAQQAMEESQRFNTALPGLAGALATGEGPQYESALASLLASGPRGAQMALPLVQEQRQRREAAAFDWGGGGAPAAPQAAATPAVLPAGDPNLPRGIRNNNPLNLTYVAGQPGVQGSDGRFGRYGTPEEGIAAATRQLQMYGQRGLTTPAQIIGRWAPPSENNTGAYVAAVARQAGLDPNQPVNLADPAVVSRLVGAMAQHENGRPMDPAVVQRGVQMALAGEQTAPQPGDAIQASGPTTPGQPAPAAAPAGVSAQEMAVLERALASPNPLIRQRAQARMQMIQLQRRETPRMETVRTDEGVFMVDPTNPERRVRVGAAPETAPRSPERYEQDRALAEAGAARSQTTVNAGDRRTDVLVADAWDNAEQTARDAGRRNVLFQRAERAFERFAPGALAERRIWMGQMARELGIRTSGTSEGEILQQVQRQLELAATPRGQGAITENERHLVREAVPVLLRTPEGARAAIGLLRQLDDYEMQIARIYREDARANGGQPNAVSVREKIAEFVSRNQPPDVQAVIDQITPRQPAAAPGIQADPPAPAAAPVRVQTPEEAARLPPGTAIILPDGRRGRVPGG